MKKIFALLITSIILVQCIAIKAESNPTTTIEKQETTLNKTNSKSPKLVIGIVVDQMRYDYLIRFYNKYGEGGFKRLMNKGYNLNNVHYNYIPTYTAVGHTSIYTGTTPTNHGIISNNWYDKYEKKSIYCVDDDSYETIGAKTGGKKSPHRMLTTTILDQLRLSQNMNGKSIGISIKDRSAILPAGHTANAAYWFEGGNVGKFITSSFYMDKLPSWVDKFNNSGVANNYLEKTWNTYYDINSYNESIIDDNNFEKPFKGKSAPSFPYNLSELRKVNGNYDLLKAVAFGNDFTTDFAKATILGENLGKSKYTDFLAISFSSTDYVGHRFGVDSKEIEDTYIRIDKNIEDLINFLNTEIGSDNYTLFLTADHAAVQVPSYLKTLKIPGGYFDNAAFKKYVNSITFKHFNSENIVENISNNQLFLNTKIITDLNLDILKVEQVLVDEIINFTNVYKSVSGHTLQATSFNSGVLQKLQNGYNQKRSGNILFVPKPTTISYAHVGSTHGSGYSYDTHVPLIFYGNGIKQGSSDKDYPIVDIAPTLASFLKIEQPNGTSGKTITEVLE
ncbi:alkaline phosphatase PafA [Lutibacter citreus]|uniref:alkaline phosphatase PafA n=1 Tax=Lutibacter citreus TaxID=2138210 RepID=UPI000DBE6E76|nr:alkaline phosphatase PafA [Lutibacter citreus]